MTDKDKYFTGDNAFHMLTQFYKDIGYEPIQVKPLSECSLDDVVNIVNAHYNNEINLTDYWTEGDTITIQFAGTSITDDIETAHPACDMQIRIIGFNHDDLVTPINGHTKAAVTFEFVYSLQNACYIWGKSVKLENSQVWSNNPRRTWLNNDFKLALPEAIRNGIKTVVKTTKSSHKTQNATDVETTNDDVFLLSVYEVYKDTDTNSHITTYHIPEGNQYKFYETSSNRIATDYYINDKSSRAYRWLRSPASYSNSLVNHYWCYVSDDTKTNANQAIYPLGLAPAFCL